jgi:hypothetical protein
LPLARGNFPCDKEVALPSFSKDPSSKNLFKTPENQLFPELC